MKFRVSNMTDEARSTFEVHELHLPIFFYIYVLIMIVVALEFPHSQRLLESETNNSNVTTH